MGKILTYILLAAALMCHGISSMAQTAALKTNVLYDAATTMNLGAEVALGERWTLDVSGLYNPWTFNDNRKMKLWAVQPEIRRWNCDVFSGGFWAIHAFGGEFNFGGMLPWGFNNGKMFGIENENILHHRYQGWGIGAGIAYGYDWVLGKHWNIEAELGAGYAYLDYEKYKCEKCGEKLNDGSRNYFGPTKASISLVYVF